MRLLEVLIEQELRLHLVGRLTTHLLEVRLYEQVQVSCINLLVIGEDVANHLLLLLPNVGEGMLQTHRAAIDLCGGLRVLRQSAHGRRLRLLVLTCSLFVSFYHLARPMRHRHEVDDVARRGGWAAEDHLPLEY